MLKIMIASFLNRIRRPNHSDLWNTSFPFALSISNIFMSSIGGCREHPFLAGILYPGSAATAELIGHLQAIPKHEGKGADQREEAQQEK